MAQLIEQKWDIEAEATFTPNKRHKREKVFIIYKNKRQTTAPPAIQIRRAIQRNALEWCNSEIKEDNFRYAQYMSTINYFLDNYPEIEFLILHNHLPEEQRCELNQL